MCDEKKPVNDSTTFRKDLEKHLLLQMEYLFENVPFTRDFHMGKRTELKYYTRHMIEAVLRIRLNNSFDAYCLNKIASENVNLAKSLVKYLADEFDHDELIISDLGKLGIPREEINDTESMFSTQLLMAYVRSLVDIHGPLPNVLWNWFLEWYSNKYNMLITKKAKEEFGTEKVVGALSHLDIDKDMEHLDFVSAALGSLIKTERDIEFTKKILTRYVFLVRMYFQELYDTTITVD